jgi:S1-C subfamily serine protease
MFCPHCRELIQDGAIVCKHCHRRVQRRLWPLLLALVVLVAVAAAAVVFIQRGSGASLKEKVRRGAASLFAEKSSAPSPDNAESGTTTAKADDATTEKGSDPESLKPALLRIVAGDYSGTGFIISEDGLAVTCAHVVEGTLDAMVYFHDGSSSPATVKKITQEGDLALLQIDRKGKYPFIQLGDSTQLKSGQEVIVIGYPLGLDTEVLTRGVISAAPIYIPIADIPLIQIDASVNPGNSGGPVLDHSGRAVGVVAAKLMGADAMNWVVPINYVSQFGLWQAMGLDSKSFMDWRMEAKAKLEMKAKERAQAKAEIAAKAAAKTPRKTEVQAESGVKIVAVSRVGTKLVVVLELIDEYGRPAAAATSFTVEATWPPSGRCVTVERFTPASFFPYDAGGMYGVVGGNGSEAQVAMELNCPSLPASGTITINATSSAAYRKGRYVYTVR